MISAFKPSATKDTGWTAEQGSSNAKNKCFSSYTWYQGTRYNKNHKRWSHFYNIMPIYEANFDVLFSRNSSQIGKQTIICWWVFHRKRQTHSGKSLVVSFCRVTTTAEAKKESIEEMLKNNNAGLPTIYQNLMYRREAVHSQQCLKLQHHSMLAKHFKQRSILLLEYIMLYFNVLCVWIVILII